MPPVAGCATACSCLPWPAVLPRRPYRPHTTPTTGQAIPLLTHTPYYSAATAASHCSQTSEPSSSSPRGHPLPRLPRLHVVPFLGLAVVHRRGAVGAAWSMWSTTDFHRKSSVRGEADSWVHGSRKKVPPYYAQKNEYPLLAGTHHIVGLTCGPTKLMGTEGFVNLVNMNDSSSSDRTMSIQRP